MKNHFFLTSFLFVFFFIVSTTYSQASIPIFEKGGYAVRGYDVVAYFKEKKPVKGQTQYSVQWQNATWLFSTEQNKNDFIQNPKGYAPQYGGFCAYGVAGNYFATTEPDAFTIVNNKLYLNYNISIRSTWQSDRQNYIDKANSNWVTLSQQ